jgi:hypothetical protein
MEVMAVAILRLTPGVDAPWTGRYALATEWETTPFSVWCHKGERLPLIAVADDGPRWFILVETSMEKNIAA